MYLEADFVNGRVLKL